MAKLFSLGRKERLKSRKQIDELFSTGKSFNHFPLRVTYSFQPSPPVICQVGFAVSKRNFKKAVDRNRVKRLLREAYRTQKALLNEKLLEQQFSGSLFIMFTGKEIPEYRNVCIAVGQCLVRLQQKIPQNESSD